MPEHVRPLTDAESISRALTRLDPTQTGTFYPFPQRCEENEGDEVSQILDSIRVIDAASRAVIVELLGIAVENSSDSGVLRALECCQNEFLNNDTNALVTTYTGFKDLRRVSDSGESMHKLDAFMESCTFVKRHLQREDSSNL